MVSQAQLQGRLPPNRRKKILDLSFKEREHPAPTVGKLPREAQSYITKLERTLYNLKNKRVQGCAEILTAVGVVTLYGSYLEKFGFRSTVLSYLSGFACLIVPWVFYLYYSSKNTKEFSPEKTCPGALTKADDYFRTEYDLNYIDKIKIYLGVKKPENSVGMDQSKTHDFYEVCARLQPP